MPRGTVAVADVNWDSSRERVLTDAEERDVRHEVRWKLGIQVTNKESDAVDVTALPCVLCGIDNFEHLSAAGMKEVAKLVCVSQAVACGRLLVVNGVNVCSSDESSSVLCVCSHRSFAVATQHRAGNKPTSNKCGCKMTLRITKLGEIKVHEHATGTQHHPDCKKADTVAKATRKPITQSYMLSPSDKEDIVEATAARRRDDGTLKQGQHSRDINRALRKKLPSGWIVAQGLKREARTPSLKQANQGRQTSSKKWRRGSTNRRPPTSFHRKPPHAIARYYQ